MPLDEFESEVLKFIENHRLISPSSKVLVALSGGIDSMSLLHVLLKLRRFLHIEIVAAHMNHLIRSNAFRDEEFVKEQCATLGVQIYVERVDVPSFCAQKKVGIEEGARILRYDFLERARQKNDCDYIALGHNLNDLAETILYRMIRGTGLTGMVCMLPKDGHKIRPFLHFKRDEIEAYAMRNRIPHVEDESNLDVTYARNYIRHKIMPVVKVLNEDVENTLKQIHFSAILFSRHAAQIRERYRDRLYYFENRVVLNSQGMDELEIVEMLKSCVEEYQCQLGYRQIEQIVSKLKESSWTIYVSEEVKLKKGFEFFSVEKIHRSVQKMTLSVEGLYEFNEWLFELSRDVKSDYHVFIDAHQATIRTRRKGDKIFTKKLKDLFIEAKIPHFLRDEMPLVCVNDEVVWVPYVYLNNSFKEKKNDLLVLNLLNDPYSCILKERSERRKMI
ncbi:MAG: tRNA lysidine(34) synthetase TilS [Pseudothermotoga sp.]